MQFVPKKLYYKIREACEIVGVEAHVLRFWESEFAALSPPKSKTGQRIYRPKDIELLLRIRKLLYEDGFTIAGARKKLESGEDLPEATLPQPLLPQPLLPQPVSPEPVEEKPAPVPDRLQQAKIELENILTLLNRE
jgi:DNA-binding transcriptional MerR regulator